MNRKVRETIKEYRMLSDVDGIVVGCSGGADSVALLHYLHSFCKNSAVKVYAAHVNHMLRGEESDRDEDFVREFCTKLDIPLFVLKKDVAAEAKLQKTGLEECGRNIRYRFFEECMIKTNSQKIATAHTLSDNTETLLFHITRGTGLQGLCGISPHRYNIIRPLLFVTREEVEEYCKENSLSFVTDLTNFDSKYARNKLRLEIIPLLKELNPELNESIKRLTTSVTEDFDFLSELADKAMLEAKGEENSLKKDVVTKLSPSVAKRCLKKHLVSCFAIDLDNKKLNSLYNLIKIGETSNKLQLKSNFYAILSYDFVLFKELKKLESKYFNQLIGLGTTHLPNGKTVEIVEKFNNLDNKNLIDYDKIKGSIFVRQRNEGDRFTKKSGVGSKTLKRLFIDEKIPAALRQELLVFTDDEEIIFVEGFGVSKSRAPDNNSKHIFTITITGGQK